MLHPATGRTHSRLARSATACLLAALATTVLTGCGLEPFTGDGAGGSSASASPGPAVQTPLESVPQESPLLNDKPDPHSTVGALAQGFPTKLLPVRDGAEVLVSSVEPIGDSGAYQVSLNLRTTLSAADVVATYRTSLTAAGFTEAEQNPADAALAAQSTFTRSGGDELLVIGVLDRDGVRTVTIGGRLRSES